MTACDFQLQPFAAAGAHADLTITGSISRDSRALAIRYGVQGPRAALTIPASAEGPARRRGLWEETCFELFLAGKDSRCYWEFNLSPSGDWNVYRFDDYREGMREEPAFAALPFRFEIRSDGLWLALECFLDGIVASDQALEVALSAVIKHGDGKMTYWALTHPGPFPDFHRRDSFIITL